MLKSIIRKEILSNFLSYKFSVITALTTILILASILMMYRDYGLAMENYETLARLSSKSGAAVITPTPLSIFVKGLEDNLCRSYEGRAIIEVSRKQQSVNKVFRLFTTADLLYVIKVVLSLCAMLFAFDMVCGEKEAATLRQSLSNSLGRPLLILGKWIGGFTSFIVPLFLAVLLGTTFVALQPTVAISPHDWARLGLFLLSSVIYLAVFFSLGLLISCLTHQASSALVVSLSVWTLLVFLIPNLGIILARELVETPTVQQLEVARTYYGVRLYLAERRMDSMDHSEFDRLVDRVRAESDQLAEDYRNRFNRLLAVSQNITRMSPAAAFTFLATDIMGTGVAEERRLKSAVLQYIHTAESMPDSRPAFHYERSTCSETLAQGGMGNLLILMLFGILFGTGAYVAFLRYDVR